MREVYDQLNGILVAIERLAGNAAKAKRVNAAGQSLALDAIVELCVMGDEIYEGGKLNVTKKEVCDVGSKCRQS